MTPPAGIEFGNEEHGRIIAAMAPALFVPGHTGVISRMIDGEFAGGVLYEGHIPNGSMVLHAGARDARWWNRTMAWAVFAYPFLVEKVDVCLINVLASNKRSLRFCEGLGFRWEHRIPDAAPGGGIVLLSMRKSGCRWIMGQPPEGFLRGLGDEQKRCTVEP
jgi:RimJ/RimL family protein N-acetyltransferase